jgi:chitodextrinase
MNSRRLLTVLAVLAILCMPVAQSNQYVQEVQAQTAGCTSSSPSSGAYTVTVCITSPTAGSTVSGNVATTATATVTGTNPGVQRMVFNLNGTYLLTDYQSSYTFSLPTTKWVDGSYTLSASALMRDAFTTAQATITVNFNNGISSPPVNTNQFQPSAGIPPANGAPFVVVASGDGASGETNATNVTNLIASINPNLFLYLGDVYEKGSVAEFYNWYGPQGINFGRFRSLTNPTIGNHEYTSGNAPGYFDYWDNIPNYYSYDAGGWHFISLNSNSAFVGVDTTSPQYTWLAADLAAHANTCTIAYYHHPLYNIGPEGNKTSMAPIWTLMAQNGVSIVINGHDHDYQRWVPLDSNGNPSPSGITEFVAGGAGHGLQTFKTTDSRVAFSTDANPGAFGALKLSLNASGASFSYINTSGATIDSGVIPCLKAGADTQAPSTPGSLSATASSSTRVDLSWLASTDNVGVNGYTIYRNGASLVTVSGSTLGYSDTTASPSTTYSYTVDAFDAAGNHSTQSTPAGVTTPAMPSSLTFPVAADTYVNAGSPTTNYGGATTFRTDATPDVHAYLRFIVQGLAGSPIRHASLKIYPNNTSNLGIVALVVADNNWGEKTTNYNNAPALGAVLAASGAIAAGNWITLDVTPYITGEGTFSFGVITTSSAALSFPTRESGSNAAQLVLDFSADTQAPSVPNPVTATAYSSARVDLSWPASTDNIGVTGYTIYRNGVILTTVLGSTLSYSDPTVSPSTTYSYAVDAYDAAANHSAQSTPVSVTTPAPPTTLTIPVAADTYVNASSPTTNYGAATTFRLDASPDVHAYLQFNVQGLPGTPITRVRLMVYANNNSSLGIRAQAVADNGWGERTMTYNTAPALGAVLATSPAFTAGSWITLDVTPYITGNGLYSFGMTTTSSTAMGFQARESNSNAAQLIIDY